MRGKSKGEGGGQYHVGGRSIAGGDIAKGQDARVWRGGWRREGGGRSRQRNHSAGHYVADINAGERGKRRGFWKKGGGGRASPYWRSLHRSR